MQMRHSSPSRIYHLRNRWKNWNPSRRLRWKERWENWDILLSWDTQRKRSQNETRGKAMSHTAMADGVKAEKYPPHFPIKAALALLFRVPLCTLINIALAFDCGLLLSATLPRVGRMGIIQINCSWEAHGSSGQHTLLKRLSQLFPQCEIRRGAVGWRR